MRAISCSGFTDFCSISASRSRPSVSWKSVHSARRWVTLRWNIGRHVNEWCISVRRRRHSDNATWPAEKWLLRSVPLLWSLLMHVDVRKQSQSTCKFYLVVLVSGLIFSNLLRKILGRFLILGQSLVISGKTLTRQNFALGLLTIIHDSTPTSLNNVQHNTKIKVLITIIINALIFPNSRLVLC